MAVQIVRELPATKAGAQQVLVQKDGRYYVVSSVLPIFSGFETLVFPAREDGEVANWSDVAGGRGMSREEAIADLDESDDLDDAE